MKDFKETTVEDALAYAGFESLQEAIADSFSRGQVPSCCECQSYVEPDGKCPHGNPSVLRKAGVV